MRLIYTAEHRLIYCGEYHGHQPSYTNVGNTEGIRRDFHPIHCTLAYTSTDIAGPKALQTHRA